MFVFILSNVKYETSRFDPYCPSVIHILLAFIGSSSTYSEIEREK